MGGCHLFLGTLPGCGNTDSDELTDNGCRFKRLLSCCSICGQKDAVCSVERKPIPGSDVLGLLGCPAVARSGAQGLAASRDFAWFKTFLGELRSILLASSQIQIALNVALLSIMLMVAQMAFPCSLVCQTCSPGQYAGTLWRHGVERLDGLPQQLLMGNYLSNLIFSFCNNE